MQHAINWEARARATSHCIAHPKLCIRKGPPRGFHFTYYAGVERSARATLPPHMPHLRASSSAQHQTCGLVLFSYVRKARVARPKVGLRLCVQAAGMQLRVPRTRERSRFRGQQKLELRGALRLHPPATVGGGHQI